MKPYEQENKFTLMYQTYDGECFEYAVSRDDVLNVLTSDLIQNVERGYEHEFSDVEKKLVADVFDKVVWDYGLVNDLEELFDEWYDDLFLPAFQGEAMEWYYRTKDIDKDEAQWCDRQKLDRR